MYYDSFGIDYIPQDVLHKIKHKPITLNIIKIQSDDSSICEIYCSTFTEYMITGKTLLEYTNLFSPNDYKKNEEII